MQERENNAMQTSVSREGIPINNSSGYKRLDQSNVRSQARSQVTERHSQRSQNTRSQRRPLSRISREQRSTQRSERKSCNASNRSYQKNLSHQSSYTTVYKKVTESNVTNPGNLVCDFCINKDQYQKKLEDLAKQRQEDVEFAKEVNKRLQEELEEENRKLTEKRRIYMEAIMNQQKDNENKRQIDLQKEQEENDKFNEMMRDNSDLLKKQAEENERKRKFIDSLKGQIQDKEKQNLNDKLQEAEVDKNSPNLLINDAWRIPQREAMKEYYLNNLVNQIKEKEGKEKAEMDKEEREKQEYRNELDNLIKEDEAKMKALEAQKRKIFLDEIQKQLQDKDNQNQKEQQIKDMEDAMVRAKLERDDEKTRDNLFKKKQEMQKYLDDLVGQKYYDDIKKKEEALKAKQGKNTGLDLGKKHMKCYNCANCLGIYPLKQLNKKRRVHV